MATSASGDSTHRLHWALWALATLASLTFAPGAFWVTHRVYHLVEAHRSILPWSARVAMWVGSHLGLLALVLSAGSAVVIVAHRPAGGSALAAQALLFVALLGLMVSGMMAPFELMCAHPEGLVP